MRCAVVFVSSLVLHSLLMAGVKAEYGELDDESPFNYDLHSEKGPEHWGNLKLEWRACGKGKYQSPIDLVDDRIMVSPALKLLKRTYKPTPASIRSRGHDIMVEWHGDAGGVKINGTEFKLLQCHWHSPSEHAVNGKRFKMEIHMVHNNSQGHISVIGIMYKLGRPDTFLAKLLHNLKNISHEPIPLGIADPWDIKFGSRKYLRYSGSLTVPPCTEGVLWTILKKVRTVSREQIRALRDAVYDEFENNARPIQDSDKISVHLFHPHARDRSSATE